MTLRPKVLLVCDVRGWAFDQNMHDLVEYLGGDFDFDYFYVADWFQKGVRPKWASYDVIYEVFHRNPPMGIPYGRAVGALRSEWFKPEAPGPATSEDVALVNRYRAFQVATQRNYEELLPRCPRVVYLTNPVNTRRFAEPVKHSKIIASWNGNPDHRSFDGRSIKHFYDIAVPACECAEVELVAALYGAQDGPRRQLSHAEMPAFYQRANVALCTSEYEAASNSVMEAMAAGLAVIATDVGNHREMRDSQLAHYGASGIVLVERSVDAFVAVLRELTPERAAEMGEANRREIGDRWSWRKWAPKYAEFLRMAL